MYMATVDGWLGSICREFGMQLLRASAADRPQRGGEDASLGADSRGVYWEAAEWSPAVRPQPPITLGPSMCNE